ncbi:S66 peptidase family protein [Desulfatibacillum aliphaticivorans]|uniref:S66 peptidase family protein n=1 Tax=Desulfatibacillum aliphaticivorans TaxID=218208 RepID=UPI0004076AB9|nr:LD-carboxypeptidase [Desulfatibacillum aliphaticivorans]
MPIFPDSLKPLEPGDVVGVAAPASCFDADLFEKGLEALRGCGFEVRVPKPAYLRQGYLAGSDQERARAFMELWEDPEVKAVLCARGGYGVLRILPLLDFDRLARTSKVFVGYSDITGLMQALMERCGLPVFHGPVITGLGRNPAHAKSLARRLSGEWPSEWGLEDPYIITPGSAAGLLAGGNLATLCHLAGTPFQPDFAGKIVFLEDVGEAPYRIDRMLTHLRLCGMLNGMSGILLGSFYNCGEDGEIRRVLADRLGGLGVPVLGGFPAGHGPENKTFPMGTPVKLDADQASLTFRNP